MSYTGLVSSLPRSVVFSLPHGLAKQGGSGPPFSLTGTLPNGNQGTDYLGILNISGGVSPYSNPSVIAGSLPADFSLMIMGNQLRVVATAPIAFFGNVSVTLDVEDSTSMHASLPVTFSIEEVNFLITEGGDYIVTEDGRYIITES